MLKKLTAEKGEERQAINSPLWRGCELHLEGGDPLGGTTGPENMQCLTKGDLATQSLENLPLGLRSWRRACNRGQFKVSMLVVWGRQVTGSTAITLHTTFSFYNKLRSIPEVIIKASSMYCDIRPQCSTELVSHGCCLLGLHLQILVFCLFVLPKSMLLCLLKSGVSPCWAGCELG